MKTNEFLEKEIKNENRLPIEGYEGSYEVSSEGRVRSYYFGKVRILKPVMNNCGYLQVQLHKDGKMKHFRVHRLVAQAFVPDMSGLNEVNRINEDKTDNRAENLMWCDRKENQNWGTRSRRVREKNTNGKLSKTLLQFSKNGEFIRERPSASEVERVLGFFQGGISMCCLGKCKSAYSFVWKYK